MAQQIRTERTVRFSRVNWYHFTKDIMVQGGAWILASITWSNQEEGVQVPF